MSGPGPSLGAYLGSARTAAAQAAQQAHVAEGWQAAKARLLGARDDHVPIAADFEAAVERAKRLAAAGAAWARENPEKAALCGAAGAVVLVTVAAPGAVATPVLAVTGFGSEGVVGGSLAAGIQSGAGSVVSPSLFATCQSAAMGGYGVPAVVAAVQVGGAAVAAGAGAAAASIGGKKKREDGKGEHAHGVSSNQKVIKARL
ncbi:hypothetical protein SLS62_001763 [Diatrype stigma]|uniref:Uncharacterized protein n=1 Tax=Diatrype stigma TaxID=117547 RepID=A0AAN9YT26_9PEZI